jgi:hypothetical protein
MAQCVTNAVTLPRDRSVNPWESLAPKPTKCTQDANWERTFRGS